MWWLFLGVAVAFHAAISEPSGNNTCLHEEQYQVNETIAVEKNYTVREYIWCMNVPPRCSKYSQKKKTEFIVEPQNKTRIVRKCCPGFIEVNNTCASQCDLCKNGICNDDKICLCSSGYYGDNCDIVCDVKKWGPYCRNSCDCENGNCDPVTGRCICPSGYTGNRCELTCKPGAFGIDCKNRCACADCNSITGECPPITTSTTTRKTTTTTTTLASTTTETLTTVKNQKIEIDNAVPVSPQKVKITTITEFSLQPNVTIDIEKLKPSQEIDKEKTNIVHHSESDSIFLVLCATILITLTVTLVAIGILVLKKLKSKRKQKSDNAKENMEGDQKTTAISTFSNSIFHTPLPELPTFTSPHFGDSPEKLMVCSLNFPNTLSSKTRGELFYDAPPSTGSYRAASSVGGPDFEQKIEPLYDEIPCWKNSTTITTTSSTGSPPSYKTEDEESLYINSNNTYMNT